MIVTKECLFLSYLEIHASLSLFCIGTGVRYPFKPNLSTQSNWEIGNISLVARRHLSDTVVVVLAFDMKIAA